MDLKVYALISLALPLAFAQNQNTQPANRPSATEPVRPGPTEPAPAPARGRGGATNTGAGSVWPGTINETPVVTHHEITVAGKPLSYTATVGQMPINTPTGENQAHIFYVAYTLDGVTDLTRRPLTFAFNGGPGSASMWVHVGAMGPRKVQLLDNGEMPSPPFKMIDNPNTWLDRTDLVFIDPVGTGYSRARTAEIARQFQGVQGDLDSVGEFIRMYINRSERWASPLFIAGESYGTFRAAGLAGRLIDQGIAFNGITLISTVLDYQDIRFNRTNGITNALHIPTYTADAFYHEKLPADLQKDLRATLKEAENWAMTSYLQPLNKGTHLPAEERKAVIKQMARYTGLDPRYIDESDLRIDVQHFTRELLRDKDLTIGRLDGRLGGPSPLDAGERADFDPADAITRPPFQAVFLQYVRGELGYKSDMTYYVTEGIFNWNFGAENRFAETGTLLAHAFAKNPQMKLMVCASYFDLATPYFQAQYALDHIGLHPETLKNITWQYYMAGHMMYIDKEQQAKLKRDEADFIQKAISQ